eukprot:g34941.t1
MIVELQESATWDNQSTTRYPGRAAKDEVEDPDSILEYPDDPRDQKPDHYRDQKTTTFGREAYDDEYLRVSEMRLGILFQSSSSPHHFLLNHLRQNQAHNHIKAGAWLP